MFHSFVAAKLIPRLPAWATYGHRVAPSLATTPFLALHIHDTDPEPPLVGQKPPNLFVLSHEKPQSPNCEYFVLNQDGTDAPTETLTVVPPLPFAYPLYLSMTPRLRGDFSDTEAYRRLAKAEPYQLDPTSSQRFRQALKDAKPSIPGVRETGGRDVAATDWDTWSGESPREAPGALVQRRFVPLTFDLIDWTALPARLNTHVFEQIRLFSQLYLDYTWEGCQLFTNYIESMREALPRLAASGRIFREPSLRSDQVPSQSSASDNRNKSPARATRYFATLSSGVEVNGLAASHLASLAIPHDGEPSSGADGIEEEEIADDWKDEEVPVLEMEMASLVPPVRPGNIKIIVMDCASLVDVDSALRDALDSIFPSSVYKFASKELLDLYVEHDALRRADGLPESFAATVQEVARYLGADVSDAAVQIAEKRVATPTLYPDAIPSTESMAQFGCAIIALPGALAGEALSQIKSLSFAFADTASGTDPVTWKSLLEFCERLQPGISIADILVVTPNLHGVAEPAGRAAFPTAVIKRQGRRSARLSIPTFSPTYAVPTLDDLLSILRNPDSIEAARDPVAPEGCPPLRIRNCYQVTFSLGSGSHGFVWNAIQLGTGAGVAVKLEMVNAAAPSTIAYESAVYAQLVGVKGIPRIHWAGQENNAQILVMDKLGPNLEKLRRLCRGAMSLKTVLMLGQQMLNIVEDVHTRGILVRDIKPENFAMGLLEEYKCLHLLDMGLGKLYVNPTSGEHMPFRDGRGGIGTPRYASHNIHFGLEPSRRDDLEALGMLLLYLLHGRLPWQGICAPNIPAKLIRIGEMKRGRPFADLLATSPPFFTPYFEHCRALAFETKPDYVYLRRLLRSTMAEHGWEFDWKYDWWSPAERGTLLPGEYTLDQRFVQPLRHRQDVL